MLARAGVQAARGVLQQDFVKDKQTGEFFDAPTDLWAFPITNYAIGDGLLNAQIEDERGKLNLNDLAAGGDPTARKIKVLRVKRLFELVQVNLGEVTLNDIRHQLSCPRSGDAEPDHLAG